MYPKVSEECPMFTDNRTHFHYHYVTNTHTHDFEVKDVSEKNAEVEINKKDLRKLLRATTFLKVHPILEEYQRDNFSFNISKNATI